MKTFISLSLALFFTIAACSNDEQPVVEPETPHQAFISNLNSLCGETFIGAATFPHNPEHTLVDTELRANISKCEEDLVHVNLYRDGDTWHATWILSVKEDGLHLYHDHIGEKEYPEGEAPITGYGGFADDRGNEFVQYFPADEPTIEILDEMTTNVWKMEMDLQNGIFIYNLERHNAPRFRAELYLN